MQTSIQKINSYCLVILALVALTGVLIYTKAALLPFTIGLFVYALASPTVSLLEKKLKVPKWLSLILTIILVCSFATLVVFLITISIQDFIQGAGIYKQKVIQFVNWATEFLQTMGYDFNVQYLKQELRNFPVFKIMQNLTGDIFSLLGNVVLVLIFSMFLLIGDFQSKEKHPLFEEIQNKIAKYVATKFLTSLSTGVIVGVILWIVGGELVFMFALLTMLLNFIPSIGSIIATLVPLPVLLLQFGFGWEFISAFIAMGITQFFIGNVLEPKVMGESMDLHPITIMIFLIFWGLVWDVPGMFMAVPITALVKIVLGRIPSLQPLSELMAGRIKIES